MNHRMLLNLSKGDALRFALSFAGLTVFLVVGNFGDLWAGICLLLSLSVGCITIVKSLRDYLTIEQVRAQRQLQEAKAYALAPPMRSPGGDGIFVPEPIDSPRW